MHIPNNNNRKHTACARHCTVHVYQLFNPHDHPGKHSHSTDEEAGAQKSSVIYPSIIVPAESGFTPRHSGPKVRELEARPPDHLTTSGWQNGGQHRNAAFPELPTASTAPQGTKQAGAQNGSAICDQETSAGFPRGHHRASASSLSLKAHWTGKHG